MACQTGRKLFSLNYLFASFFGAAMIGGAFAYYNYKFSQFKFLDFKEHVFYEKKDLFEPKDEIYAVLVYSSNMNEAAQIAKNISDEYKILAVDLYQKRFENSDNIVYITSGINTIIPFLQKFDIYKVPSVFAIKKEKGSLYKQDSKVQTIE